jgi:hypothetical protein
LDEPKEQLPATIHQADITADPRALNVVPALIADLGDEAAWRYVEFFTANIRSPHTRRACARRCARFFAWCEERGLVPDKWRRRGAGSVIVDSVEETGGGQSRRHHHYAHRCTGRSCADDRIVFWSTQTSTLFIFAVKAGPAPT